MHIFVDCDFALQCWQNVEIDLLNINEENFGRWLCKMFEASSELQQEKISVVL